MAAGKAGLESLPYFVDECVEANIPQLEPFAIDHSREAVNDIKLKTQEKTQDGGCWRKKIFNMSREFTQVLENERLESRDIVKEINPAAASNDSIADCPANIAAAMRTRLSDICARTYQAWEEFKAHNSSRASDHLAVVIPYCPEGPTSGTVGMLIGAGLRRYFQQQGKSRELVVWGIELCNPANVPEQQSDSSPEGEIAIGNDFRGYVARAELCQGGVALENRKEAIQDLTKPFDINIAVDGGKILAFTAEQREKGHQAIDRAAAQITVAMLQGPVGDTEETREILSSAPRWNAMLMHYTSWREFHTPTRYRARRYRLPWVQNPEQWEHDTRYRHHIDEERKIRKDLKEQGITKKEVNLAKHDWLHTAYPRLDQLLEASYFGIEHFIYYKGYNRLEEEYNIWHPIAQEIENARRIAEKGRKFWRNLLTFGSSRSKTQKAVTVLLDHICKQEQANYEKYCLRQDDPQQRLPEGVRNTLFCVTMKLPQGIQEEAAAMLAQNGYDKKGMPIIPELASVLGTAGTNAAKHVAQQEIEETMMRPRPRSKEQENIIHRSSAQYRRIIGVHCQDSKHQPAPNSHLRNSNLAPDPQSIRYLLARERQGSAGSYTEGHLPRALKWEIDEPSTPEVMADYSYIILAETPPGDGFCDISSYPSLRRTWERITSDQAEWRKRAKYYSGNPPHAIGGLPDPEPEPETKIAPIIY